MRKASLGPLGKVSRITLGGGGLGAIWGPTSADEAVATVHAALEAGVTLIDTAPMYRDCEAVIGRAFEGRLPAGVRITTKHFLGAPPAALVAARLEASLTASLAAIKLDRADVFFLHSNICEDDYVYAHGQSRRDRFATPWSLYAGEVISVPRSAEGGRPHRRLGNHRRRRAGDDPEGAGSHPGARRRPDGGQSDG